MSMELQLLQEKLREFASERDWGKFHSPKNLSMALSVEAAELLEHFQWITEEESLKIDDSSQAMADIKEEVSDVFLYLLRLADVLNIDLVNSAKEKIALNAEKYPVTLSKGNATKVLKLFSNQLVMP